MISWITDLECSIDHGSTQLDGDSGDLGLPRTGRRSQVPGVCPPACPPKLVNLGSTSKSSSRRRPRTDTGTLLAQRTQSETNARVTYLCTAAAARAVDREAGRHLFRDVRNGLTTSTAFDQHGKWILPIQLVDHMEAGSSRAVLF